MRYVVTGAAGFVGSRVARSLLGRGDEVVGVDCLTPYYEQWRKQANLAVLAEHPGFTHHPVDLSVDDLAPVVDGVDVVLHLAGQPGVRASWGPDFEGYVRHNVTATQRLLEASTGAGIRRLVYSSSSSVYGNVGVFPTPETALPQPFSPYGVTKLAAEHLCGVYAANRGLAVVSLRLFTVYGPGQRPDMGFHRFIESAIEGTPIELYGDGGQRRDFTHVDDVVDAFLAAAGSTHEGHHVLNVAGGSQVRVTDVLDELGRILGRPVDVRRAPEVPGDVRDTGADCTAIGRVLGWSPSIDLEAGLRSQVEWHRARRAAGRAS